jgi:hypothetical protein
MVAAAQGQIGEERERAPFSQNCKSQNGTTANADTSSRASVKARIVNAGRKLPKMHNFEKGDANQKRWVHFLRKFCANSQI